MQYIIFTLYYEMVKQINQQSVILMNSKIYYINYFKIVHHQNESIRLIYYNYSQIQKK